MALFFVKIMKNQFTSFVKESPNYLNTFYILVKHLPILYSHLRKTSLISRLGEVQYIHDKVY